MCLYWFVFMCAEQCEQKNVVRRVYPIFIYQLQCRCAVSNVKCACRMSNPGGSRRNGAMKIRLTGKWRPGRLVSSSVKVALTLASMYYETKSQMLSPCCCCALFNMAPPSNIYLSDSPCISLYFVLRAENVRVGELIDNGYELTFVVQVESLPLVLTGRPAE